MGCYLFCLTLLAGLFRSFQKCFCKILHKCPRQCIFTFHSFQKIVKIFAIYRFHVPALLIVGKIGQIFYLCKRQGIIQRILSARKFYPAEKNRSNRSGFFMICSGNNQGFIVRHFFLQMASFNKGP